MTDRTGVYDPPAVGRACTDWHAVAARDEIRPTFSVDADGEMGARLLISTDEREGLQGFWERSVAVTGGCTYRFRARRRTEHVPSPRRSAHVTVSWEDDRGEPVFRDEEDGFAADTFLDPNAVSRRIARPEYPRDGATDASGWTEVASTFRAPARAARARLGLHLRWAPRAKVEWTDVSLTELLPTPRRARLAAANLWPRDDCMVETPLQACQLFANLIEAAAADGADLICLPEGLTATFTGLRAVDVAEPIPGPSTAYFGDLAKRHNLYIVAGLYERAGHLVHNTAVLVGADGSLVGAYRKVCLTTGEGCFGALMPGQDFPVFDTRIGKVGMMICWDMEFPEIARALANRGAEIIAVPVAGMHPILASARAIENQVYIVMSSYSSATRKDWLKTGILDYDGNMIAATETWGTVAIADVTLGDEPRYWANLGDLKGRIPRMRPVVPDDGMVTVTGSSGISSRD